MLEVRLWRHLRLGSRQDYYLRSELGLDQYLHLVRYTIVPCNLDIGIKNKTTYLLCIGLISEAYRNPLHGVTKQKYPIPFHLGQVSRTTRGWLASTLDVGRGNESRTEGLRISRSGFRRIQEDCGDSAGFRREDCGDSAEFRRIAGISEDLRTRREKRWEASNREARG